MQELVASPVPVAEATDRVAFTGRRAEFVRLVMRGALLELVTLGFYRFWLATDMRRHLWSHTSVGGDAPEYTGTAKELLIGFLFALAILAADLSRLFLHRPRSRAAAGLRQHSAVPVLLPVRPVRDLSRAPLPADPHGLARGALLDDGLGLELCVAGGAVGACSSSSPSALRCRGARRARALQDAPHASTAICTAASTATGGQFFKRLAGSGCWRWLGLAGPLLFRPSSLCCPSSTGRSRRSNGAGGCPASASARCVSSPI